MNTGIISSRYSRALLAYAQQTGRDEAVASQVERLLKDPVLDAPLEPALEKIVALLVRNGRQNCLKYVLTTYLDLYRKSRSIRVAHLKVAALVPGFEDKVKKLLESRLEGTVELRTQVDESLIGGFTLETEGYLLDASVSRELEKLRARFKENNFSYGAEH